MSPLVHSMIARGEQTGTDKHRRRIESNNT